MRSYNDNSKLFLYSKLKSNIEKENYLKLENFNSRQLVTKFRISDHSLHIETGRYKKIPREFRLCKNCKLLDDEEHFFLHCGLNDNPRINLMQKFQNLYPNFNQLDSFDKLNLILNPIDGMLSSVVDFLKQSEKLQK